MEIIEGQTDGQIAGMNLEQLGQKHSRRVGQMGAGAAFDLRKILLRDRLLQLLGDGADDFLLGHLAAESPEGAFHFPQVAKLFTKTHITICNNNIAYCDKCQEKN